MRHNEDVKSLTIKDTPFGYTLSLISGKWKMLILYLLSKKNIVRFNEMRRMLGSITYKTLSTQLKELEADELIIRKEYPQIPPKVEYSLSEKGKSLIPILDAMCNWGVKNQTYK
ncbi:MAG: helix-turn-helix transcriptional regulator [Clostridiales bacterium]|nr:helix-turn-helix transcriptional regulator [Clostridiales bacterium]